MRVGVGSGGVTKMALSGMEYCDDGCRFPDGGTKQARQYEDLRRRTGQQGEEGEAQPGPQGPRGAQGQWRGSHEEGEGEVGETHRG